MNTDKETEHVDANEAGDNEEEEDLEKQDPFYVDEQAMEAEFANLTDAELEVNYSLIRILILFI